MNALVNASNTEFGWIHPFTTLTAAELTDDPFADGGSFSARRDALLHFRERLRTLQIDIELLKAAVGQMGVGVVEAGHDEAAVQVEDFGIGTARFFDLVVRPESQDFAVLCR